MLWETALTILERKKIMKNTYTQKKTGKNIFNRQKLLGFMLLFLFMLIPLSSTALAIEEIPATEIEPETPLPITTPDSLLLAIENAGEGDTISLRHHSY